MSRFALFRSLLALGRVSNLPTVWSNCLAGWWLGGGGNLEKLPLLFAGATFLYTGGMFLNDAFDAEFDRQFRRERPIPSGAISREAVWRWSFVWMGVGALLLILLGRTTGILAVLLVLLIVFYDALHKQTSLAPALMGTCRLVLYLVAASAGTQGITGWPIWCGLALGIYVVGISYFARRENTAGLPGFWPCLLLAAPIALASILNVNQHREAGLVLSLLLGLWILRSLRPALWSLEQNVGQTVSLLLAGIVFVDLLAVADAPREFGFVFLLLFGSALVLQRFIPAT